jgi:hypothetical protein
MCTDFHLSKRRVAGWGESSSGCTFLKLQSSSIIDFEERLEEVV